MGVQQIRKVILLISIPNTMSMDKHFTSKLIKNSVFSSLGVVAYITLIAFILNNGSRLFGQLNGWTGPIAMLLMIVVSAAIVGTILFARPFMMFFNNQKRESVWMVMGSISCLILETVIFFFVLLLKK